MRKGDFQRTAENVEAGRIVKRLREALALTQTQFAHYLHVRLGIAPPSQPTVWAWEAGDSTVPAAIVIHAVDRLGDEVLQRPSAARAAGSQSLTGPYLPLAA